MNYKSTRIVKYNELFEKIKIKEIKAHALYICLGCYVFEKCASNQSSLW